MFVALVGATKGGRSYGVLHPSVNVYPSDPNDPIGTPSIHYGVFHDLYSTVLGFGPGGDSAVLRFFLNPGVMWVWVGGAIVACGGLVAAWPTRRPRIAAVASERRELAVVP